MSWDDITPAELRTLYGLADGRTAPEIAAEQHISTETVKGHVAHLRLKLGARNSAHIVALAYHRGILIAKDAA